MEILAWFVSGMIITNLLFFIYWYKGNDIEYTTIFIYIACILSGPFSILLPLIALFCYMLVRIYMKIEDIYEEPFLKGRRKNKKNIEGYYNE